MAKKFPAQKVLAHDRPWEERSYFSSIAPFRCSRRKACTLHESLPPQGGTSACHADASSPLREILCHLDPEILRPSPELGAHPVRSRGAAGRAPVRSASWQRTPPVPVVQPQRRLASKPKRDGARVSWFLRGSDIAAPENRLAEPESGRRHQEQIYFAYPQRRRCNYD